LTVFTVSLSVHPSCCLLISLQQLGSCDRMLCGHKTEKSNNEVF